MAIAEYVVCIPFTHTHSTFKVVKNVFIKFCFVWSRDFSQVSSIQAFIQSVSIEQPRKECMKRLQAKEKQQQH